MTTQNEADRRREAEEQHNESERVRSRIDRLLRDTAHLWDDPARRDAATIDAYAKAENERTGR